MRLHDFDRALHGRADVPARRIALAFDGVTPAIDTDDAGQVPGGSDLGWGQVAEIAFQARVGGIDGAGAGVDGAIG